DTGIIFTEGYLLEQEGKYTQALEKYQQVIALDPQAYNVYQYAVNIAIQLEQVDVADELSQYLIEKQPDVSQNWVLKATATWAKGNIKTALTQFDKALKIDPDNIDALYRLANMLKTIDPNRAKIYFKEYAEKYREGRAYAYYELGNIEYDEGKFAQAIEYFKKSKNENVLFLEPRYSIAHTYQLQGNYALAIEEYKELEEIDKENENLFVLIAKIYLALDDQKNATEYFLKAKDINKSNPEANLYLANLAESKSDFENAIKYTKENASYNIDYTLWTKVSYYLIRLGKKEEAVEELERASERWPDNAQVAYFLSLGYDDIGETQKALLVTEKLLDKDPEMQRVRFQYAVFAEKMGKVEEAENALLILLEKNPEDDRILNFLGYMLAERGIKLEKAYDYVKKALEIAPDNGAYLDSLAWVHYQKRELQKSKELIERALRTEKSDAAVWYHAGVIYSALKQMQKAWYALKVSVLLTKDAKKNLKQLGGVEKNLSAKQLSRLYLDYLYKLTSGYDDFFATCKIKAKAAGKTFFFNGILKFSSQGELTFDIMGPFYTPIFNTSLNVQGDAKSFYIPEKLTNTKYDGYLKQLLTTTLNTMWDYFSGEMFQGEGYEISGSKKNIKNAKYKLYLDDDKEKISQIKREKIKFNLSDYTTSQNHHLPQKMTLKARGIKLEIEFTKSKAKFVRTEIPMP
ncbi:MAG TPA: tetratricopeptide repeat protein, partial [Elusimicrobiales bacterium]|nr:tetratricopeptide repeat protein [Elusimicrobiales bacterium]